MTDLAWSSVSMPPTTEAPQTIGGLIRAARERAGLSQADLARKAGVHLNQMNKYERDRHEPGVAMLTRIATALDVPVTELVP